MLPPDTTQTILPEPRAPGERRGDGHGARALGDDARARSTRSRTAAAASASGDDERAGEKRRREGPHLGQDALGRRCRPRSSACSPRSTGRPAAREAVERRRGLDLAAEDPRGRVERPAPPRRCRTRARPRPTERARCPHRGGPRGSRARSCRCRRSTAAVGDGVDEEALDAGIVVLGEHLPPALDRDLHDAAAEPLDRVELRTAGHGPGRRPCREFRAAARSRPRPGPCCRPIAV